MKQKKGFVWKLLFFVILAFILWALYVGFVKAETSITIVNITAAVNSTNISIAVGSSTYYFSNTPSVISIQQNFTFNYETFINLTNSSIITNFTCSNLSVFVACSCPSISCPSVSANYTVNEVDLKNETKIEFYNHYVTQLGSKIEESGNKAAQDIIFKLEPTKAQIEECQQTAFNASIKQNEAERQRDEQVKNNQVITGFFSSCKDEKKTLQVIFFSFIALIVVASAFFMGLFERFGMFFGGGRF